MKISNCLIVLRKILVFVLLFVLPIAYGISQLNLSQQRVNQKLNMRNIRLIAMAVESYGVDHNAYPPGNSTVLALKTYLEPKYIKKLPTQDTWGNSFLYHSSGNLQSYTITSYGKDHKQDPRGDTYLGPITRFTNDIRFSKGIFIAFPEGT